MSAALKYILEFESVKRADVYKIEIYESGYLGSPVYKNVGEGHVNLTKDEGIIQKTTLEISIQSDEDFEYTKFFEYNNLEHPVKLYKNNVLIWSGFYVAESYSEPYQNPPYDVTIVATDGLGFLENFTFGETGFMDKLNVIRTILQNTGLTLDFEIAINLFATGMTGNISTLEEEYFYREIYEGSKYSDVLTALLPFGAVITQHNNKWRIWRPREDYEVDFMYYQNNGDTLLQIDDTPAEPLLQMGDLATGDVYPVNGAALLEMEHAWKDAIIKKDYGKRESFLLNHNFADGTDYWTESPTGQMVVVRLNNDYFARLNSYVAPGSNDYISQSVAVTTTDDDFVFECNYDAIGYARFTTVAGFSPLNLTVRIAVTLGSYYLSTAGWTTTPTIMEFDIESSVGAPSWKTLKIICDNIPATGTLTVKLYRIEHAAFPVRSLNVISGSVFTNIKLYTLSLLETFSADNYTVPLQTNAAESGNTITVKPVSLPNIVNSKLFFNNGSYLSSGALTTTWSNNGGAATTIENVIANQLKAYHGSVKHKISGTDWRGENLHLNCVVQHLKNSSRRFVVQSGTWDIYADEFRITWIEIAGNGTASPTQITGDNNGSSNENATEANNGLSLNTVLPNGFITMPVITWLTGLTYSVSACKYVFNNTIYESVSQQFTLDAAHATLDRIDTIALDADGDVAVIKGTAAANPVKPQINPASQLEISFIDVPAGETAPTAINTEVIYNENTEWTGVYDGATGAFNATTDPFIGSVHFDCSDIENGDTIIFTASSPVNVADFKTLSLFLELKERVNSKTYLAVNFMLSGSPVSTQITLKPEATTVNEWQQLSKYFSQFSFWSDTFDAVKFVFLYDSGSDTYAGFFLDMIQLQDGITQALPTDTYVNGAVFNESTSQLFIKQTNGVPDVVVTIPATSASGASSYIELTDTSDTSYTGKDLHVPMVDEANDELDLTPTELATFFSLDDFDETTYTGKNDYYMKCNESTGKIKLAALPSIPVKASAAELNTGIDDAKFATAKGLKDAEFARIHVGTSPPSDTTMLWLDTN